MSLFTRVIFVLLLIFKFVHCLMTPEEVKAVAINIFTNNRRNHDTEMERKLLIASGYFKRSARIFLQPDVDEAISTLKQNSERFGEIALLIYRVYNAVWRNSQRPEDRLINNNLQEVDHTLVGQLRNMHQILQQILTISFTNSENLKKTFPGVREFKKLVEQLYDIMYHSEIEVFAVHLDIAAKQNVQKNVNNVANLLQTRLYPDYTRAEEILRRACPKRKFCEIW